ncbi:MAG TPA: DNA polymerase III subunit delta [Gaiellaceae bacterium]
MASELRPVYLITGSDRPKVARAVRRLRDRVGVDAAELLSATDAPGDAAVAACNSLGLFTDEARLVVVEEVERWRAADAKAVAEYLQSPAPATVLALVGEGVKADSALAKACKKAGEVLVYDAPRKRDLPAWVAAELQRRGASAEPEACRAIAELVGEDLEALATEIDKLATWAHGEEIGVADVERLVVPRAETTIFSLTDAWGRRDVRAVLEAAESLLERSPRELTRVVGALASHVAKVRACQALAAEAVRPRDAASRLKMHPFAAEKAFAQAANFSVDELGHAVVRLAALDLAVKGGSRLSPDLELARALVDVTRPREAATTSS